MTTTAASGVTYDKATLMGTVDGHGKSLTMAFDVTAPDGRVTRQFVGSGFPTGTTYRLALTGLRPASSYSFRLVAIDAMGTETKSTARTFQTAPLTPPAAVTPVSISGAPTEGATLTAENIRWSDYVNYTWAHVKKRMYDHGFRKYGRDWRYERLRPQWTKANIK